MSDTDPNKKVLLRKRKRHTARHVASTPYVVLTGYPSQGRVPPILTWPGGPYLVTPQQGTPRQGTPLPGYPPGAGYPPWAGYPPQLDLAGYPPWLPHGILGNVAKHYGIWVPPLPADVNRLKTLPSPILRMRAVKKTSCVIQLALEFLRNLYLSLP